MDNTTPVQHLFFDMDNTLTRSRSKIMEDMKDLLALLPHDIVVTSGARFEQICFQMDDLPCYILAQNGNHAMHGSEELWRDLLAPDEVSEIMAHIASLAHNMEVPDPHDLIENRGSQISYSVYGHHAPVEVKERVDPDQRIRAALLTANPLVSETIEVKIAGTTCLDYFRKGRNKGYNVARLCSLKGWEKTSCLYFGDALFPGGNDETVIGIIPTQSVTNPRDTYERLLALRS